MTDVKVEVRGIRELAAAFKKIDAELAAQLKTRFLALAQHVVGKAQAKMEFGSGPAAGSVKARGSTRGASIAFGGSAAPYYPWLDFGGSVGKGHQPGKAFSGSVKRTWLGNPAGEGRYVYPAISESKPETIAAIDAAIKSAAEGAGFETKGGL